MDFLFHAPIFWQHFPKPCAFLTELGDAFYDDGDPAPQLYQYDDEVTESSTDYSAIDGMSSSNGKITSTGVAQYISNSLGTSSQQNLQKGRILWKTNTGNYYTLEINQVAGDYTVFDKIRTTFKWCQ